MRVLVTGAGGYIGTHVVSALLDARHDVIAVERTPRKLDDRVHQVHIDIFKAGPDIYDLIGQPDVCIHLAWEQGFVHNHASHISNIPFHINFIRNMLAGGLKQIVTLGTMHEIGYHVGPVTEKTPTNPSNAYGISKNFLQRVQQLVADEFGAVQQWLRCFYITGDDARNNSIFRKMLEAEMVGKPSFPLNSGEMLYDFIDVTELGRQIGLVATQANVQGIINCCSGRPVSLRTKVLDFIQDRRLAIKPEWGVYPTRSYDSVAIWGDRTKLDEAIKAHSL